MLIHLINFLRQSVTLLGELVPLREEFTDKLSKLFSYYFKRTQSVFEIKKVLGSSCVILFYGWSFHLWSFSYGKNVLSNICYILSLLSISHCYCQVAEIFTFFSNCFFQQFADMPYLNHNEKVSFENCGTQTTQLNLARHRKRCSAVSTICSSCTNLSTKSRAEMNYRIARKHSKPTARKCKISDKDFHSFYKLREQKRKEHGA